MCYNDLGCSKSCRLFGGADRHLSDLLVLNPTDDEMLLAARWCLTQDASEVFPQIVESFLRKVGWDHIAELV